MRYVSGTRLDDRIVRTDWDAGFIEGRQFGRGKTGGQVRYTVLECSCIVLQFATPKLVNCDSSKKAGAKLQLGFLYTKSSYYVE